jgi:hypothetical protein
VPQFEDTSVFITDTANWMLVSGTFTSLCNCQYMVIGNFYNDANTDTIQMFYPYNSAYYYIDDVSITECIPAGVKAHSKMPLSVYPDPVINEVTIDGLSSKSNSVNIYNSLGQKVQQEQITGGKGRIDVSSLLPGVYFLHVQSGDQLHTQKLVKE